MRFFWIQATCPSLMFFSLKEELKNRYPKKRSMFWHLSLCLCAECLCGKLQIYSWYTGKVCEHAPKTIACVMRLPWLNAALSLTGIALCLHGTNHLKMRRKTLHGDGTFKSRGSRTYWDIFNIQQRIHPDFSIGRNQREKMVLNFFMTRRLREKTD